MQSMTKCTFCLDHVEATPTTPTLLTLRIMTLEVMMTASLCITRQIRSRQLVSNKLVDHEWHVNTIYVTTYSFFYYVQLVYNCWFVMWCCQ